MRKAIVHKRIAFAMSSVLAALIVAGCAAPGPPQKVSATLPGNAARATEDPNACAAADTLVAAQCIEVEEYHSTVLRDRVRRWYLTEWRVIRVERGYWPEKTIRFAFHDSSPVSESGIVFTITPPVYYPGAIMAFCVDTNRATPTIVAQQPRSRVPSYGTLSRPRYDARDPETAEVFQRVLDTARAYAQRTLGPGGTLTVTEEYDTFFVVEVRYDDDSVALRVEKGSYRVTQVPDAYDPGRLF